MLRQRWLTTAAVVALVGTASIAEAQEATVLIDGSSTVFPISEAMAEEFQKTTGIRVVVGVSGTGGGFKKFCRGETNISGASRPIRTEEMELCKENGIEFIELPIAIDALSNIVHPSNSWADCMTVEELKIVWEPEAQDKIKNWNQIRADFPDAPLKLFGAGVDSGTYDYYTAAIVGKEHSSRGDYTATEDDNVTIQGVAGDVHALGFLGLAYVEENRDKVKTVKMKQPDGTCVEPSVETARDGSYQPLSRPLFFYVNKAHADEHDHVRKFVEFVMDAKHGTELVAEVGYVPLPEKAFELGQKKFADRKTGTYFAGGSKIGVTIEELLASEG
jgi:phosphate transport system substrate-binding protein